MEEEQKCKCPAGIPAWVLTFADLMSLLMCFFVLLLSFAEMDVLKFKQIAGSLKVAFGVQRDVRAVEIPKGINIIVKEFSPSPPQPTVINEVRQKTSDDLKQDLKTLETLDEQNEQKEEKDKTSEAEAEQSQIDDIREKAEALSVALSGEVQAEMVEIAFNKDSIVIRIREKGSFPSGTASLTEDFIEVLEIIADELRKSIGNIIVAGHTDNIPINTPRFRSNWALSSARAVAVTHELINENKLDKSRFSIQAFADSKPLAEDNETAEKRALNRRVEIIIAQGKNNLTSNVSKDKVEAPNANEKASEKNNESTTAKDSKAQQQDSVQPDDGKISQKQNNVSNTVTNKNGNTGNNVDSNNSPDAGNVGANSESAYNKDANNNIDEPPNFIQF